MVTEGFNPIVRTNVCIRLTPCRNRAKVDGLRARLPDRPDGPELFRVRNGEAAIGLFRLLETLRRDVRLLVPGQTEPELARTESWFRAADTPSLIVAEPLSMPGWRDAVRSLYVMNLPPALDAAVADLACVGREGLDASAEFFASGLDRDIRLAALDDLPGEDRERELARLNQAVAWTEHDGCARMFLAAHVLNRKTGPCGNCGWCLGKRAAFLPAGE